MPPIVRGTQTSDIHTAHHESQCKSVHGTLALWPLPQPATAACRASPSTGSALQVMHHTPQLMHHRLCITLQQVMPLHSSCTTGCAPHSNRLCITLHSSCTTGYAPHSNRLYAGAHAERTFQSSCTTTEIVAACVSVCVCVCVCVYARVLLCEYSLPCH